MVAPPSFGSLFSQSWSFFQKHVIIILIGAVAFGALNWVVSMQLTATARHAATGMMGNMPSAMQQFAEDMQKDPTAAMRKMAEEAQNPETAKQFEDYAKDQQQKAMAVGGMFAAMVPMAIFSMILSTLISLVGVSFFMILAIRAPKDIGAMLPLLSTDGVKMVALWIWTYIRTFAWIPIIGIIPAIILGPRFILGPLMLLEGNTGVTESVSASYKATTGMWWIIVKNSLLAGICVFLVTLVASAIVGMLGGLFLNILHILAMAFMSVFSVMLARAIWIKA